MNIEPRTDRFHWADPDLVKVNKKDANPYHEPAGSEKGGRFARAPGESDGSATKYLHGENSEFQDINRALRGEIKMTPEIRARIASLDKDFSDNGLELPEGTTIYRGMKLDNDSPLLKTLRAGRSYQEEGYLSTTTDKAWATAAMKGDLGSTDVMMTLTASSSKHPYALYHEREKEYTFQRGAVVSVKKVSEDSDGNLQVEGTVTLYKANKKRRT